MTKTCRDCRAVKPLVEFHVWKKSADGHYPNCKTCRNSWQREHYKRSPERRRKVREVDARWKIIIYGKIVEHKRSAGCTDCGERDPVVLDFDHLRDKSFNLAAWGGRSWPVVLREIEKCEVVCANCHRRRSHRRRLEG